MACESLLIGRPLKDLQSEQKLAKANVENEEKPAQRRPDGGCAALAVNARAMLDLDLDRTHAPLQELGGDLRRPVEAFRLERQCAQERTADQLERAIEIPIACAVKQIAAWAVSKKSTTASSSAP